MSKRVLEGTVVSDKMDKTVVIQVVRRVQHPVYRKFIKKIKKYMVHDDTNQLKEGDVVRIIESRPLSKNKKWTVLNK